ncbi:MAG TPA: hypothetical protein VK550_29605 [Polyangiaceae bacterium]|nr:hypothetical protein [Polyangiaceae bacterium]
MKRTIFLAAAAAILAAPATALANGRYPAASQLVVDPTNPQHIVVSATFGLLESRDGGKTFGWLCEAAIGTSGQQDLMLSIAGNGATVVAMFNGMTTTMDGCAFRAAPELDKKTMGDLALSKSTPHQLVAFWLEFQAGGTFGSQIVRSVDDGQSWAPVADVLPSDIYPLTIDIAPSVASRVYLSARGDKSKSFGSMLMRSDDGGVTFTSADIPETQEHRLTYIAAVHPFDADRLYLRVYDVSGTVIQTSSDGGRTFQTMFKGTDQLLGFAISPDGTLIAVGGPSDGIWVGSADGSDLARRSDVAATCLTWTPDALYACADYKTSGFSVGRSLDLGSTFEGLFRFDSLCGRAACGNSNSSRCTEEWELIAPAIGATCASDAGTGSDAATSNDAAGGTSGEGGSTGGAGGGGTTGGAGSQKNDNSGCSVSRSQRGATPWNVLALLVLPLYRRFRSLLRASPRV